MRAFPQVPARIARAFPARPADAHKYAVGTVTVVGGSAHFINAPVIAGLGARAAGAGLVRLVVPDASRIAACALVPEATFVRQTATCVPPQADVTAVGMGLGTSPSAERLVSRILSGGTGRFVLDADALSVLARWHSGKSAAMHVTQGQTLVLTPHAGEAARLLTCTSAEIDRDRVAAVRRIAARYNAVVVLKGRNTCVAQPCSDEVFVCDAGNPFMAMGGMGDLLSGILAARWARLVRHFAANGQEGEASLAFLAAASAVWIHAAASDAIVCDDPPGDPSIVNTASAVSSLRVKLERESAYA